MDTAAQTGYWELTAIMVVIASWILYRYVAPKGWWEWSRAGLVEAFIIALYAEMYGFPLAIYVRPEPLGQGGADTRSVRLMVLAAAAWLPVPAVAVLAAVSPRVYVAAEGSGSDRDRAGRPRGGRPRGAARVDG